MAKKAKESRINVRCEQSDKDGLSEAATIKQVSETEIVLTAVRKATRRIRSQAAKQGEQPTV